MSTKISVKIFIILSEKGAKKSSGLVKYLTPEVTVPDEFLLKTSS